ncbi:MAG: hypothetical protein AAF726_14405 [Planctomycetota bacterium]
MSRPRARILVGYADALAAVEVVRSLIQDGNEVVAFERPGRPSLLRRVQGVEITEVPSAADAPDAAIDGLQELARRASVDLVMPLDDASLWLTAEALAPGDGPACVTAPEQARLALDKSLQVEAAHDAGLPVPPATLWAPGGGAPELPDAPAIVRPALAFRRTPEGAGRGRVRIFGDSATLREATSSEPPEPMLVQPYVDGVGEGLFGWAGPDGVIGWTAHRRVRMVDPHGSGSSACRAIEVDAGLVEAAERFVRSAGWRGQFMIELLRGSDGAAHFVEFNGRPWGSLALARRRGFEYPAWTARGALDDAYRPEAPVDAPFLTARHLGRDLVHLLSVLRGPRAPVHHWPGRWETVKSVLGKRPDERWYNAESGESNLLLVDTLQTVYRHTLGRRRT